MNNKVPGDGQSLDYIRLRRGRNNPLPGREKDDNAGVSQAGHKWCTLSCEHAQWPLDNIDGAKSCRTFSALWCKELQEHVTRNTPCALLHGQKRPKPNW